VIFLKLINRIRGSLKR